MEEVKDAWAIVELMGHVRLAGRISEEEKFGAKMGRLDIPQADGGFVSQFFGGGSVYRITLVTEAVARHVAKGTASQPVSAWDFPKQLQPAEAPSGIAAFDATIPARPDDDCDDDGEPGGVWQ